MMNDGRRSYLVVVEGKREVGTHTVIKRLNCFRLGELLWLWSWICVKMSTLGKRKIEEGTIEDKG